MQFFATICLALACAAAPGVVAHLRPASKPDFGKVDAILQAGVDDHVYPGCVAAVMHNRQIVYMKSFGNFTYGKPAPQTLSNPQVLTHTRYDLASLTKVTATTSAVAQFYQRGELDLDMPVSNAYLLGSAYANNGKDVITVRNLLLHNAGYPPDPVPGYSTQQFGCPATIEDHSPEVFSCSEKIFQSLLTQTLINVPGTKYVYSDLSMITAMYVVGTLADKLGYVHENDLLETCQNALHEDSGDRPGLRKTCFYEAYVRIYVFHALGMDSTGFLPSSDTWGSIAPTWVDNDYRHKTMQGQVSDENSYALGGVAGHAGVFSHAPDLLKLMDALLFASDSNNFLNRTTVELFTTAYNLTQSSRALGWDTNNYNMNTYRGCANLSNVTFTHTGYTGTELCGDPTRNLATILLTNRCYPVKAGQMNTIHTKRQEFNNAVLAAIEA